MMPTVAVDPLQQVHLMKEQTMCFAGMEDDAKNLVKSVAAKAEVNVLDARIEHGHLNMLVENRGWVRASDLLEKHAQEQLEDEDMITHTAVRHIPQHIPVFLAR